MPQTDSPLFEARGITKTFGPVQALAEVSLTLKHGEVHSIIGENGAGKSTLMNVICGRLCPSSGELWMDGQPVSFAAPVDAQRAGIAIAPQEINLVPDLSVAENILLGAHRGRIFAVDWAATRAAATEILHEVDDSIDPRARVSDLSKAQQQLVQIARATATRAQMIIFDEPTAALTVRETDKLMAYIHRITAEGRSAFYISHRLDEVRDLSHRITVLRDGATVGTITPAEASRARMVQMMAGRLPKAATQGLRDLSSARTVLEVEGMSRAGEFDDISFVLRRGEILGVSGLIGSGRTEMAKSLFGATRADRGTVRIDGVKTRFKSPVDAIAAGLIYLPEERKQEGIFPLLSIAENTALPSLDRFGGLLTLRNRQMMDEVEALASQMKAKFNDLRDPITSLSGGNQQKFIIARWLMHDAKVLIMDEPTRGIDVNAKQEIQAVLRNLTEERGLSIILISSEMEELLDVADRILVMHDGKVKGTVVRDETTTQESLLELAIR
ncbi:sugar ABC transporter ATP-binding protein [Octadecabacter arcticus 238]|jgi:ribose transport system ATP-binding protein|uniref:Autoinducer 2 import ATP-binding protein LsrA n=1 Tax=Octadecabacter arcticus 238 TaxID=391616 RepID=M9RUM5_9RHOB|nr:sugar ABC transporter ATP-binding protein [Octadecabacter arcticus]AGI74236.1 sugar ABC transporter ATP-binding protein [Octadecabacter arcticus 238]